MTTAADHERTAEVLNAAADVIEKQGWYQGDYGPPGAADGESLAGSPVCALGAISVASGEPFCWDRATECWAGEGDILDLAEVLCKAIEAQPDAIPHWNDRPERTVDEVLDALRAAAKSELRLADGLTP